MFKSEIQVIERSGEVVNCGMENVLEPCISLICCIACWSIRLRNKQFIAVGLADWELCASPGKLPKIVWIKVTPHFTSLCY